MKPAGSSDIGVMSKYSVDKYPFGIVCRGGLKGAGGLSMQLTKRQEKSDRDRQLALQSQPKIQ
jgi:hypothetical protein